MKHIFDFFYSKCSLGNKELVDNFEKELENVKKPEDISCDKLKKYNLKWCFISKCFLSTINNELFDIVFKYNFEQKNHSVGFCVSKLFIDDIYLKLSFFKDSIDKKVFYSNEIGAFINRHRRIFNIKYNIKNLNFTIDLNYSQQLNQVGLNTLKIKLHDYLIFANDKNATIAEIIFINFLEPDELKNQLNIMFDLDVVKNDILNQIYHISILTNDMRKIKYF